MKEVEFLKFIVEHLVDNPSDIQIERTEDDLGVLLSLKVHKSDMGFVIGKGGSIVNSLRSLLKIMGSKTEQRINLKILD